MLRRRAVGGVLTLVISGRPVGHGLLVRDNVVHEPRCGHALYLAYRNNILIERNQFLKGTQAGLTVQHVLNVIIRDTSIIGANSDYGISLLESVENFVVESDVTIRGSVHGPTKIHDGRSIRNVIINHRSPPPIASRRP